MEGIILSTEQKSSRIGSTPLRQLIFPGVAAAWEEELPAKGKGTGAGDALPGQDITSWLSPPRSAPLSATFERFGKAVSPGAQQPLELVWLC